ncbi:Hypothetical_protein [Hexamita inflata]|uniref:Hypothetical_protein n=1 Tax=Hexamita inflata TaxID=28002 RepID=A0AA86QI44_9EUKA|nr:Hypothetical protein HINF_LOCUS42728 [Hexamita inflata]
MQIKYQITLQINKANYQLIFVSEPTTPRIRASRNSAPIAGITVTINTVEKPPIILHVNKQAQCTGAALIRLTISVIIDIILKEGNLPNYFISLGATIVPINDPISAEIDNNAIIVFDKFNYLIDVFIYICIITVVNQLNIAPLVRPPIKYATIIIFIVKWKRKLKSFQIIIKQ